MARTSSFAWILLGLCLVRPALADEPTSFPRTTTQQVHKTVDRAIGYLQTESAAWLNKRQCAACHHVPMPLWALSEAERQGYAIDKKYMVDTIESLLGSKDKLMDSKIFPNPDDKSDTRPQAQGLNMGLPMLAVAARALPSLSDGQKQSLKLIAEEIRKKQQPDGSWEFFASLRRPPINESQTTDAAWIIMALEGETGADAPASHRAALAKAIAWLDAAKHTNLHQEKVLKVLLGVRSAKPRKLLQATIDELLALQRADGGWSQTIPELKSDAFATGQTLYVLALAGYTADRADIKRGVDFLVTTQMPDGSWPMTSRSTPNGEPGSSKLLSPITCAASSWATLGLARLAPKKNVGDKAVRSDSAPPLLSLYLPIPLAVPRVEAQSTGVFVPANYRVGKTIDLVVYLRGYDIKRPKTATSIGEYWSSPQHPTLKSFLLREEINKSGKNVIFVAPTLGPFAEAGKLMDDGGIQDFLGRILDGLRRDGPHAALKERPTIRHLILAAHSGGGVPLRRLAKVLGDDDVYKDKLKEIWGFDSIYGVKDKDADFWSHWAQGHGGAKVTMFYIYTQKDVGKDPKLPVSASNPFDHREPTGTTFPALELERLGKMRMHSNVAVVRETKASTLNHNDVPRTHLAELLKAATYLDDR